MLLRTAALLAAMVAAPALSGETGGAQLCLRVGKLHVGDGTVVANALIVVEGGKFVLAGEGAAPPSADVRDFREAQAAPGFIDGFTRLGLQGGAAEDVQVLTPEVRAADAFDAADPALAGLVAQGTTLLGIAPSPSNLAAGRSGAVRLSAKGARVIEAAGPPAFSFVSPALRPGRVPATLAGARRMLECAFRGEVWREAGEPAVPVQPQATAALCAMAPGPALAWADTPVAARAAVLCLREKKLDPVLVGVRDCAESPDVLAALGVPCAVAGLRPEDSWALLSLPGRLHAKGVAVALTTSAPDRSPRSLRLAICLAVAAGLPPEAAVPAVTSVPAKMLGLAGRVGRVAPGLDADLVVFDGAPWEARSRVLLVVSGGEIAYERAAQVTR